jgi:hypothetical protein
MRNTARLVSALLVLLVLLVLAGCAAGPNPQVRTPDAEGKVAGFWMGLWHGLISPVTFIISLFNPGVHLYEVHNSGGWYNAGFMLGLAIIFGGGGRGAAARRADR